MSKQDDHAARWETIRAESSKALADPAVFRRAAELIRTHGLAKQAFAATGQPDEKGKPCPIEAPEAKCFCIMGALVRAGVDLDLIHVEPEGNWSDGDTYGFHMVRDATRVMGLRESANFWNNRPDRTADEVIAALETGAQRLETERHA